MNINAYEQLGNYRLVQRLGAGGFSEVYLGEHLYLDTPAAIKVLHTRLLSDESMTEFLNEARIIAQLDHPHIVRVLDFGVEGNIPYLVLQYAPNGTVRQRYPKSTRLLLSIIVQYVKQIAEALHYAHELKIIHRDIKPENFLLGKDDEILLADFGLAMPSQSAIGISDHERAGTAVYMAPEQSQGKSSRASDQYALGVVVYEWLCGYPPFRGTDFEVLHQHIHETPLPLHEMMQGIPPAIEQVVMRTLEKEPSERFPRILDFAQTLEEAYQSSSWQSCVIADASPASDLESSLSGQEASGAPSRDQTQTPVDGQSPLSEADHNNTGNVPQEEHSSFSMALSPPSELPEEQEDQAAAGLAIQSRLPAVAPSARQRRRVSRRAAITAGMLGLAVVGGAAALYLFDGQNLGLTPIFSGVSGGSTKKSRKNGAAHSGGTTRGNTPGTDHNGAGTSVSPGRPPFSKPHQGGSGGTSTQPTPTAGGGQVGGTGTTTPLTVRIDNGSALAQIQLGSTTIVDVTTSQAGTFVTVQVTYSDGEKQTLGPQVTDGNGNAAIPWTVYAAGLGRLVQVSATLVAFATSAKGQRASSAPVNVTILLNVGGLGL